MASWLSILLSLGSNSHIGTELAAHPLAGSIVTVTMKNAITNIVAQENQGPTMDECHEKLKSMRLEPDDLIYLAATGIFCQSKSYREAWMLLPSIPNVLKKWIEMMSRQMGF
ncbi:hypothetical protein Tco_1511479 [Tanacetum coccineum]